MSPICQFVNGRERQLRIMTGADVTKNSVNRVWMSRGHNDVSLGIQQSARDHSEGGGLASTPISHQHSRTGTRPAQLSDQSLDQFLLLHSAFHTLEGIIPRLNRRAMMSLENLPKTTIEPQGLPFDRVSLNV